MRELKLNLQVYIENLRQDAEWRARNLEDRLNRHEKVSNQPATFWFEIKKTNSGKT